MVTMPRQGEVWWAESEGMRRPVLVVTRDEAIPLLTSIVVAPLTRTVRGIPTEVPFAIEDGVPSASVASFDNLTLLYRALLTERLVPRGWGTKRAICAALDAAADC